MGNLDQFNAKHDGESIEGISLRLFDTASGDERKRASAARASSAMRLARAGVGEGPKDGAGVFVHDLTKVHGDGEQEDQEKKVDPKE